MEYIWTVFVKMCGNWLDQAAIEYKSLDTIVEISNFLCLIRSWGYFLDTESVYMNILVRFISINNEKIDLLTKSY